MVDFLDIENLVAMEYGTSIVAKEKANGTYKELLIDFAKKNKYTRNKIFTKKDLPEIKKLADIMVRKEVLYEDWLAAEKIERPKGELSEVAQLDNINRQKFDQTYRGYIKAYMKENGGERPYSDMEFLDLVAKAADFEEKKNNAQENQSGQQEVLASKEFSSLEEIYQDYVAYQNIDDDDEAEKAWNQLEANLKSLPSDKMNGIYSRFNKQKLDIKDHEKYYSIKMMLDNDLFPDSQLKRETVKKIDKVGQDLKVLKPKEYADSYWERDEKRKARAKEEAEKKAEEPFMASAQPGYSAIVAYINGEHLTGMDLSNLSREGFQELLEKAHAKGYGKEKTDKAEGDDKKIGDEEDSLFEDKIRVLGQAENNQTSDWVAKKEKFWMKWCELKKYEYERFDEEKPGLSFRYYKDDDERKKGNYSTEIKYEDPSNISIKSRSNKGADYEVLKAIAFENKGSVIDLSAVKNGFNKTKLYAACVANGVRPAGVDVSKLDFAAVFMEIDEKDRKLLQEKLKLDQTGKRLDDNAGEKAKEYNPRDIYLLELYCHARKDGVVSETLIDAAVKTVLDAEGKIKESFKNDDLAKRYETFQEKTAELKKNKFSIKDYNKFAKTEKKADDKSKEKKTEPKVVPQHENSH